jgi:protein-S-isoprenylcysteine O-methyltransferase Ste14
MVRYQRTLQYLAGVRGGMKENNVLESGFLWILLALVVWAVLHSVLASHSIKNLVSRLLGQRFYRRFYRLFFNLVGVITFAPVLLLVWALPDQLIYAIPFPWVILTLLIQGAGISLLLGAVSQTGAAHFLGLEQLVNPGVEGAPRNFVSSGLYGIVRHPIYTASLLFLWLLPIMTWNLLALNLGATLYFYVGAIFEERKLMREFGETYARYKRETPMLVPGLKVKSRE